VISDLEKTVIGELQGTLPLTPRPYLEIAHRLKVSEEEIIASLQSLLKRGIIRRFGITIRHQISGFEANAMGAWKVNSDDVDRVGRIMASFKEVTHCYEREVSGDWKYNLFTMIHGSSREECHTVAQAISRKTGIVDYELLFSYREAKKTSMNYFK
jgi:DNA-binding Lrp family transcriptional regulator